MLTPQLMASMSDAHLVAALDAEINPLTSTSAEIELFQRFAAKVEAGDDARDAVIDEYELTAQHLKDLTEALIGDVNDTVALLKVLGSAGVDDAEALKAELELARRFRALSYDAGGFLDRMNDLINHAQEN